MNLLPLRLLTVAGRLALDLRTRSAAVPCAACGRPSLATLGALVGGASPLCPRCAPTDPDDGAGVGDPRFDLADCDGDVANDVASPFACAAARAEYHAWLDARAAECVDAQERGVGDCDGNPFTAAVA